MSSSKTVLIVIYPYIFFILTTSIAKLVSALPIFLPAPRVVMRRRPGCSAPSGLRFSPRPEPRSETRLQIADICI